MQVYGAREDFTQSFFRYIMPVLDECLFVLCITSFEESDACRRLKVFHLSFLEHPLSKYFVFCKKYLQDNRTLLISSNLLLKVLS